MGIDKVHKIALVLSLLVVVVVAGFGGAISDRIFGYRILDKLYPSKEDGQSGSSETVKVISEESVVIDAVKKLSPSVVTVSIQQVQRMGVQFNPFGPFGGFEITPRSPRSELPSKPQDIGTGFIVSSDGFIVTNKHVVGDTTGKYQVVTLAGDKFAVSRIYRDPVNDIAILKIEAGASKLTPVEMGDSSKLQVGQMVVAIGTALGEFRNTVTKGVISGLGRGIQAGDPYQGYVEQLDDVIQTDAAINPGNSGGPLANSAGQVIGVNVAVAESGQNIAFAIPINVVRDSIENFNKTGQFSRPFLGVRYRVIDRATALMNDVPQGVYVQEVVSGSPAEKAGIEDGDIITSIDGESVKDSQKELSMVIAKKKVGDSVRVVVWRDSQTLTFTAVLEEAE